MKKNTISVRIFDAEDKHNLNYDLISLDAIKIPRRKIKVTHKNNLNDVVGKAKISKSDATKTISAEIKLDKRHPIYKMLSDPDMKRNYSFGFAGNIIESTDEGVRTEINKFEITNVILKANK